MLRSSATTWTKLWLNLAMRLFPPLLLSGQISNKISCQYASGLHSVQFGLASHPVWDQLIWLKASELSRSFSTAFLFSNSLCSNDQNASTVFDFCISAYRHVYKHAFLRYNKQSVINREVQCLVKPTGRILWATSWKLYKRKAFTLSPQTETIVLIFDRLICEQSPTALSLMCREFRVQDVTMKMRCSWGREWDELGV